MKKHFKFTALLFLCLLNYFVSAQIKFDYHVSSGTSRYLKFIPRFEVDLNLGNTYDFSYSLATGGTLFYSLKNSNFNIQSGFNLNYYTCKMGVEDRIYQELHNPGPQYWTEFIFTSSIPLYVGYKFFDIINIFGGINNNLKIIESKSIKTIWTSHRYFYSLDLGVDVTVLKKIRIFTLYQKSLYYSPYTMQKPDYKRLELRLENINLGIGYLF